MHLSWKEAKTRAFGFSKTRKAKRCEGAVAQAFCPVHPFKEI